jgi:myo-inositol-1(or 4)-monophosphatase
MIDSPVAFAISFSVTGARCGRDMGVLLALPVTLTPSGRSLSRAFPAAREGLPPSRGSLVRGSRLPDLPVSHRPLVAEALRAATEAGSLLRRRFHTDVAVRMKGPADLVTEADEQAQRLIVRRLVRRFPEHGILAEERLNLRPEAEWRWVLDPLDGTKNFAKGHPYFCVSIAVLRAGRTEIGVVHDPLHAETFLAVRGHGAWCNGRPIRVSQVAKLAGAFLGTGVPHRVRNFSAAVGGTVARFAAGSLGVRIRGAGALDLCYVACGRFDGYWEIDQSPWDIAAGGLMVEEAGGRMSDFRGGPFDIFQGETLASNGRLHRQLLAVLAMPGGMPRRHAPPVKAGGKRSPGALRRVRPSATKTSRA